MNCYYLYKNTIMGKKLLKGISGAFKLLLEILSEFGKGASYALKH